MLVTKHVIMLTQVKECEALRNFWCNIKFSLFHEGIQGTLEGESSSLSEVTYGVFPGNPSSSQTVSNMFDYTAIEPQK